MYLSLLRKTDVVSLVGNAMMRDFESGREVMERFCKCPMFLARDVRFCKVRLAIYCESCYRNIELMRKVSRIDSGYLRQLWNRRSPPDRHPSLKQGLFRPLPDL